MAATSCGESRPDGCSKCDVVLRAALEFVGPLSGQAQVSLDLTGYEEREVGELYDVLRTLVQRGYLIGRGDLKLPSGPRYTECGISNAGREALQSSQGG